MTSVLDLIARLKVRLSKVGENLQEPEGERYETMSSAFKIDEVPDYLEPTGLLRFRREEYAVYLREELRAANLVLHQRMRRMREYKLCHFCAALDHLGDDRWRQDKELKLRDGKIFWDNYAIKAGSGRRVLPPLRLGATSFDSTVQQICPLCEVMRKFVLELGRGEGSGTHKRGNTGSIIRIIRRDSGFFDQKDDGVIRLLVYFEDYLLKTAIAILPQSVDLPSNNSARPFLPDTLHRYSDTPLSIQQLPDTSVDWIKVTGWLRDLPTLDQSDRIQSLTGFRLIDVKASCIVEPPTSPCYAALSYVWGNCKQYLLLRDNIEILRKEGSLKRIVNKLSPVVKDALIACLEMDIPYLWVDTLCIVQDDPATKRSQIANMDIVYSEAYITLVDGSGVDARSGLGRVSTPSKKAVHQIEIDGCNYVIAENPWCYFQRSKWTTRGWILQELVFSKRLLIFTHTTAILCTSTNALSEFAHTRALLSQFERYPSAISIIKLCNYLKHPFNGHSSPFVHEALEAYHTHLTMVSAFLMRKLSRRSDIDDAFAGILNAEREHLGVCRYGLPMSILARALLWSNLQWLLSPHEGVQIQATRRPGFPSWSWMGWEFSQTVKSRASLKILHDPTSGSGDFDPMIHIYGVDSSLRLIQLLHDGNDKVEGYHPNNVHEWISLPQFQPADKHIPLSALVKLEPPLSQYIIFWTTCAKIPVSYTPDYQNDHGDGLYVVDTSGLETLVSLRSSWRTKQPRDLEFIAIASGYGTTLYTMLIERVNEVAYRVAVPDLPILLDDWISREPERKLIVLG